MAGRQPARVAGPSTIVHGDYRLGNVMVARRARPRGVVAVFDWELATIGDPLADVGYLTVTWAQAGDPEDMAFGSLSAATRREGFPTREELVARYEERSGRSVGALAWYQALALWKAAVFMEGNYKASGAGRSDDEYLGLFDEGVPAAGREGAGRSRRLARMKGLLVDFGGVLTTNVFDSFRDFCSQEGLDADAFLKLMSEDSEARRQLRRVETGEIDEDEFGVILAEKLGVSDSEDLIDRLFAGMQRRRADDRRGEEGEGGRRSAPAWSPTRSAPAATTAPRSPRCTTAWSSPPRWACTSPSPRSSCWAPSAPACPPEECVFVDDLRENCEGAEAVGMTAVLHRGAETTLPELERAARRAAGSSARRPEAPSRCPSRAPGARSCRPPASRGCPCPRSSPRRCHGRGR